MYLLFDIGGSKMRVAISKDHQTFPAPTIVPTPQNFNDAMNIFREIALSLTKGEEIAAAAGGVAGPFNKEKTALVNAPHLTDWIYKPLKESLQKMLVAPVYLENDATLGGLGEAVYGAGKDKKIVAFITVSTGVGGARLVDGKIDASAQGFEPGHQIINQDGSHFEDYVSGSGFEKLYGKKATEIEDPKAFEEAARWLAFGLNNIAVLWSPEIIVLGGSMIIAEKYYISLSSVEKHLKETLKIFSEVPLLKKAELGDLAGLHGALAYIKQKLSL